MASKNLLSRHYKGRYSAKKVCLSDYGSVCFPDIFTRLGSPRKLQVLSLVKFAFGRYPSHLSGNIIFFISFIISSPVELCCRTFTLFIILIFVKQSGNLNWVHDQGRWIELIFSKFSPLLLLTTYRDNKWEFECRYKGLKSYTLRCDAWILAFYLDELSAWGSRHLITETNSNNTFWLC